MNKTLIVATITAGLVASSVAMASNSAFYLGANLGESQIAKGLLPNTVPVLADNQAVPGLAAKRTDLKKSGFAGRVFGGYMINRYFGLEAGFTLYHSAKATYSYRDIVGALNQVNETDTMKIKQNSIDVMAVGQLPIAAGFALYGKVGAAYVNSKLTNTADSSLLMHIPIINFNVNHSEEDATSAKAKQLVLAYAAGVSYAINQHISLQAEWMHVNGKKNAYKTNGVAVADLKASNLYSGGLTYKF